MLKNYFKIAFRNLLRHKAYSFINMCGLAVGIACCLLIFLYIQHELSYDRFHEKSSRIYRINSYIKFGGSETDLALSSDMTGETLKKDYPEVEEFVRIYNSGGSKLIQKGEEFIPESNTAHADSTFFDIFSFEAVSGNLKTALNDPNTVVITESTARKYFGTTEAVGKFIRTNEDILYNVTAVIKDMPAASHFKFDFIFSMDNVKYGWGNYLGHNFHTYLLLKAGTDYKEFEKKFRDYIKNYVFPQAQLVTNITTLEDFEKTGNQIRYTLTPLTKIHLYSARSYELSTSGNIQYIYIFSAVAIFILLIACINFMNLTTARSVKRASEVGIRKTLGTERKHLIWQFLSESILMVLISLLLALVIAGNILPLFNNISGKELFLNTLFTPSFLPFLVLFPFFIGVIAGSYPALYLSGFNPVQVLKGKFSSGRKSKLRSILVVVQFSTSVIIIIGTLIIYAQLNYIQNKGLGYNKDQVLIINMNGLNNNVEPFKNKMLQIPGVKSGTLSGYLPVPSARSDNTYSRDAVSNSSNSFNMQNWVIDFDYMKTLGMQMSRGRNFSMKYSSDSSAIILNETAAKLLGHDDPIGKKIYFIKDSRSKTMQSYNIIGVVKNFHFESLKESIGPLCFVLGRNTWCSSFKIDAANSKEILAKAQSLWKEMSPGVPFSYSFMDESFNDMYRSEQRVGNLALIFSVLSILIACLGLFGLATFMAEQRTKEIGIRKALGASAPSIFLMLSKEFLKWIVAANIMAWPIAYYFMNKWLQDFAYRIDISIWIFIMSGTTAILIALATISFQAVKAAVADPVKSLRYE